MSVKNKLYKQGNLYSYDGDETKCTTKVNLRLDSIDDIDIYAGNNEYTCLTNVSEKLVSEIDKKFGIAS